MIVRIISLVPTGQVLGGLLMDSDLGALWSLAA
jgi:hypothetical protein